MYTIEIYMISMMYTTAIVFGIANVMFHLQWVYSSSSETLSLSYKGAVATYSGGGFYKDFEPTGNETIEMLEELKENLWITRHTRAVFVDFTVYNVNINVFAVCKIIFELPPTGGVLPEAEFHCVRLISVVDQWDFVASICEYIFYIYILFYIMQSIREFVYFKFKYFLLFWSYVDCIISIISGMTFVLSIIRKQGIDESIELIEKNPNVYGNLEYMGYVQSMHNDLSAVLAFFVYVRLFKYLNFNKTMAQLNDTLKKCAYDILGFSIMFFIIFFAYAELGYLLFGYQVSDFRTFGVAMFSLLRTILGDFDYGEIEHAHRILAPIYFLSYIFFVFFVLLNMFLAIINDTYADVKTEIAIAPSELQMTDFIKRYFYKGLRKMGLKVKDQASTQNEYSVTAQEIRSALKKCGFEYLEIEMFFARYNIDPLANVNETDVNKLITLLEGGTIAAPKEAKVGYKQDDKLLLKNFVEQRRQLKQMEATVYKLAIKVEDLMLELDSLATGKVWAPRQHDEMPETESFEESEEEEEEDTGEIQL